MFPDAVMDKIFGVSGLLLTDLLHVIIGFLMTAFMLVHIYTGFIRQNPIQQLQSHCHRLATVGNERLNSEFRAQVFRILNPERPPDEYRDLEPVLVATIHMHTVLRRWQVIDSDQHINKTMNARLRAHNGVLILEG